MQTKLKITLAIAVILIIFSAIYTGYQYQGSTTSGTDKDALFQLAAFNTFSTGAYRGTMS